jgi:hypothetical protein
VSLEGLAEFFLPLSNTNAQAQFMPFTWTGMDSSTVLVNAPIIMEWTTADGSFSLQFDLRSLTATSFEEGGDLFLDGRGTLSGFVGSRTLPPTPAFYMPIHLLLTRWLQWGWPRKFRA